MRKSLGLLLTLSLFIPIGVAASGPAGALATALPKCTKLSGTVKYSPALPIVSSKTKVTSNSTTALKITGCKGGGITSGAISAKVKYVGNCTTLVVSPPKNPKPLISTIKWSNAQTSSLSTTTKTTSAPGKTPILLTLTSKVTAGLGKGHTITTKVKVTAAADACIKKPLASYTITNTAPPVSK